MIASLFWMTDPVAFAFENEATSTEPLATDQTAQAATSTAELSNTPPAIQTDGGNSQSEASTTQDAQQAAQNSATSTEDVAGATIENGTTMNNNNATSTIATDSKLETDATAKIDNATSSSDGANASSTIALPQLSMLATWQMTGDGLDDLAGAGAQFEPSGQYQISKQIKICGVVSGNANNIDGVYGQLFYPDITAFAPNDSRGRLGCGQAAGRICKMEKIESAAGFDLFCEKIQKNNTNLPVFSENSNFADLCASDGKLLANTAAVYCCDQQLAYDDIPGDYDADVIVKGINGDYSNVVPSKFTYLPLSKISIDFTNVNYGTVKPNVETVADETITKATARNVGNTPAKLSLWQDDMGLGKSGYSYNIQYGARISGMDASWTGYTPFETAVMPDVIDTGLSIDMDFSVKVLNFPTAPVTAKRNYQGEMKIDAVAVSPYECKNSQLNAAPPTDKPAVKPEESINATTTEI
jgi:hypothetical protein